MKPPVHPAELRGPLCCGLFTLPAEIKTSTLPTQLKFLIDSGSCLSILPRSYGTSSVPLGALRAANNSQIPTYGTVNYSFRLLDLPDIFNWHFTIADTIQPILGADFFEEFALLVDCRNHKLIHASPNLKTPSNHSQVCTSSCSTIFSYHHPSSSVSEDVKFKTDLPTTYPGCFQKSSTRPSSSVFHYIPTTPSQPFRTKKRDLPLIKLQAVEKEFLELESSGIIRRSSSPWASAIHVVTKSDGSFRPCGDYRFLNSITIHDSYPMPLISDIMNKLNGMSFFSKIDLERAFHQIPVLPEDVQKTAVITPFGLFEYLMMPFGLRNAAQTFQRHIDHILKDFPFATAYLDDILIFSPDFSSHDNHLRSVLKKLSDNCLKIKLSKCDFFRHEVQFLGHSISSNSVRPITSRLNAISELPLPKTVTKLRSFLGAVNFYHRFIPHASSILAPLSSLSVGPKNSPVTWSETAIATFNSLKLILSNLVSLRFYNPKLKLQLTTDASDFAIGAVLHQISENGPEPLEFFSRKLNSAQQNYSAFDRELLAIHDSVKHFRNMLDGRSFEILTDHKPLLQLSHLKSPSPRQLRHISFLSEFSFSINHISGKDNVVADFFSRPDISSISRLPLFNDTPIESFIISEKDLSFFGERAKLINNTYFDISIPGCPRPILPPELRKKTFDSIHSLHHPGNHKTYDLLHTRCIWPYMRRDIKRWCKECVPCQENKISRHTRPPIIRFPTGNRFEVLHIDLVGPLPMSQKKTYILTMIDRKTRWVEAVPLSCISATNVAKHLISTWFSRYGIPDHIITDQGTQFEGSLFLTLSQSYGFKHIHTTSYHPQANGLIERFHRSLKTSLRCLSIKGDWVTALPMVLLGWRNTVHSASGSSPAKLLFGIGTTFPAELFGTSLEVPDESLNVARQFFLESDTNPSFGASTVHKSYVPKSMFSSKFVWLQSRDTYHMKPRYLGPFEVIQFKDNNTVTISRNGSPYTINLDKVKPAYGFNEPTPSVTEKFQVPTHQEDKKHPDSDPAKSENDPDSTVTHEQHVPLPIIEPSFSRHVPCASQKSSLRSSSNSKSHKKVNFAHWAKLCEPRRSTSLPGRYIRTKN